MIENQPEHAAYLLELIGHDLNNISGRTSFQAMRDGDMLGTKICNAYIEMLGCGLINAVNIFQPDIVCLGGGVCNEGEALLEPLRKLIEKERYPVEQSHPFTPVSYTHLDVYKRQGQHDVLFYGQMRKQIKMLKYHADMLS